MQHYIIEKMCVPKKKNVDLTVPALRRLTFSYISHLNCLIDQTPVYSRMHRRAAAPPRRIKSSIFLSPICTYIQVDYLVTVVN